MNKPIFTVCPLCGEICIDSEPHDEIVVREYRNRRKVLYIHKFCTTINQFKEVDEDCGMMWDEL